MSRDTASPGTGGFAGENQALICLHTRAWKHPRTDLGAARIRESRIASRADPDNSRSMWGNDRCT
jgi:hypothetical protein